jgi:MoaA/NifB/PqqE/SkfB family radical SAM enzyme
VAFITLGSNDVYHMDTFEKQMRAIIEFSIEKGVVPVLSTKADNLEGDGSLNLTIAQLAREYGVPLWNYWLAVQPLPDQGLQDDQVHLTWGPNQFDDPQAMKSAWAMRNLTALQTLDIVWRSMINLP